MKNILLFDLGGVLVELNHYPLRNPQAFKHMSSEQFWAMWLHSPLVRAFDKGEITAAVFAEQVITEFELNLSVDNFMREFTDWPLQLFPGTEQLLARIKPEYTKAILSNTNELHWPEKLRDMGAHDLTPHNFISHYIGLVKPDLDCYQYVLQQLHCQAGDVTFFDDNIINVEAARSLGITAFVTKGIEQLEQQLLEIGALV